MIGDVAGKPGMIAMKKQLPRLIAAHQVDFVVANGENVAGGVGITPELTRDLFKAGVDCVTTGNHIWRQREIREYISSEPRLLRPLNFPKQQPGNGFGQYETAGGIPIGVVNLQGRVFMDPAENPFKAVDEALLEMETVSIILVDMHAEATSERRAMGFYLDGRVTAVVGTHTHVQTADEQILEQGTGYITDLGMTGPHDSVIGMRKDLILDKFINGMPHSFKVAKGGVRLQGLLIDVDRDSGLAAGVTRIDIPIDK
jgi:2',3'-cyclic-nucleotide 2'-phosphodiesterase